MTRNKATSRAARYARIFKKTMYVIVEGGSFDYCSEAQLETFFYGAKVVDLITPISRRVQL